MQAQFPNTRPSNSPSCKANKAQWIKAANVDVNDVNSNMPDYFQTSINRAADKRVSQILMQKVNNKICSLFFSGFGV